VDHVKSLKELMISLPKKKERKKEKNKGRTHVMPNSNAPILVANIKMRLAIPHQENQGQVYRPEHQQRKQVPFMRR
jgi:hypothetical protein